MQQERNTTGGSDDAQLYDGSSLPQFSRQQHELPSTTYNKQAMPQLSDDSNNANHYMTTIRGKDNNSNQPNTELQVQFTNLVTTGRATRANNDQGPAHQMDFDEVEDDYTQVQKMDVKSTPTVGVCGRDTEVDQPMDLHRQTNETQKMMMVVTEPIKAITPHDDAVMKSHHQKKPSMQGLNNSMQSVNSQNNQQEGGSQQQIRLSFRQSEPIQAVNASFSHNNSKIHEKGLEKDLQLPQQILPTPLHAGNQVLDAVPQTASSQATQMMHHAVNLATPHPLPHLLAHSGNGPPAGGHINRSFLHQSNMNINNTKSNILDVSAPFTDNLNYDLDIVQDDAIDHETVSLNRLMSLRNMPNYHRSIKRADWGDREKADREQSSQVESNRVEGQKVEMINKDKTAKSSNETWTRNMPPHPNNFKVSPGRGRVSESEKQVLNQKALGLFEAARNTDKTFVYNEKAPEVIIRHENTHHLSGVLNYFNTEAKNPNRQGSSQNVELQDRHQYNQRSARIMPETNMLGLQTPARDDQGAQMLDSQAIRVNPMAGGVSSTINNNINDNNNHMNVQDQSYSQFLSQSQMMANPRDDNSINRHTVPVFEPASVRIVAYRQTEYTEAQDQGAVRRQMVDAATGTEGVEDPKDQLIEKLQAQLEKIEAANEKMTKALLDKEGELDSTKKELTDSEKENKQLKKQVAGFKKLIGEKLGPLNQQLKEIKGSWQQAQEAMQSDLTALNIDLEGQMMEVVARAESIAKKQKVEEKRSEEREAEIARLGREIEKMKELEGKKSGASDLMQDVALQGQQMADDAKNQNGKGRNTCEQEEQEGDQKADTPQKNPVFDKYVDTQLLVGQQQQQAAKPVVKAKAPPGQEEPAKAQVGGDSTDDDKKAAQVKTTYYALATGKAAPKDGKGDGKDGGEEDSEDDDDDDDDGHTFKTITEKPFEEDQVTTVQGSVSKVNKRQNTHRVTLVNDNSRCQGDGDDEDDSRQDPDDDEQAISSDHTQEKDFMNNESVQAAGIASPQTVEAQEAEQLSQKSRKSVESKVSKKTEKSYDYSVKTQQQQQQPQNPDASEKFQQDFTNLKAKFESILKKDDEIASLNNEIEKSTRSLSRGRRSQLQLGTGEDEGKQVSSRPHSQQVQQQSMRLQGDQLLDKQDESCTSDERRELVVKDMLSDKGGGGLPEGVAKNVESLMPTAEQQEHVPISLNINRHQGIVRTTRVTAKPNQQRQQHQQNSNNSSEESEEEGSKQYERGESDPKGSKVNTSSQNLDMSKGIVNKSVSDVERKHQLDLSKSGRASSPDQMKTPMVIELNADDSDISPLQNYVKEQSNPEEFELEKIKFSLKETEQMAEVQNAADHQKDFQLNFQPIEKESKVPVVPSVSFGSSVAVGDSGTTGSAVHQMDDDIDKTQKNSKSPPQDQKAEKYGKVRMSELDGAAAQVSQSKVTYLKSSFNDTDFLAEENEDEDSPGIDAKIMKPANVHDNKAKFNNVFPKQGHRVVLDGDSRNSPSKIRTYPSPVNQRKQSSNSPPTLEKIAESNNTLGPDEVNNTAASIVQWRTSNISNEPGGPRVSIEGPQSNAPSSARGKSDNGPSSFDEEIEHSPPRKSVQNLNNSEKKQTSLQKQQERQQSPTPRKSSSSNNSGGDDEVSDEEDSHLITITERTYEESCTCMNSSNNMSQVSVSQLIMDDIKQKLQNNNKNDKKRQSERTSEDKKRAENGQQLERDDDTTVGMDQNYNTRLSIGQIQAVDNLERNPLIQTKQKEDQKLNRKPIKAEKDEDDFQLSEDNGKFETLLNDVQTATLRNSLLSSNPPENTQSSFDLTKVNNSNFSAKNDEVKQMPQKQPFAYEMGGQAPEQAENQQQRMTGNLDTYASADFGEFDKDGVDRQMVKPALTNIVSPRKLATTPIEQALKRGILNPQTNQMLQKQAAMGHAQSMKQQQPQPSSIQTIHLSQPAQKKPNKYFASNYAAEQDRSGQKGQQVMANSLIQSNNVNDSINSRADEQGNKVNKSQASGWQNQSQQSLSLLTPLQILSLASNSEREVSQNNVSSQYLAFNDTSLNTTKLRGSTHGGGTDMQHQQIDLNNSRTSQKSKRMPTENSREETK